MLIAADNRTPADYEVFLPDQPVCRNAGVCHQVISLSEKTMVKITENIDVECIYYELDREIEVEVR